MAINLRKLADSLLVVNRVDIGALNMDDFDRLYGVRQDYHDIDSQDMAKGHWRWTEEVRKAIERIWDAFNLMLRKTGQLGMAAQEITVTADDLSTTDTANDTLTFKSQTDIEFDFTDGLRISKVVLSPGRGVRPMDMRFDMVHTDMAALQGTVYAESPTTLQAFHWDGTVWQSVAWDVGWTVRAVQYVPLMFEELVV